MNKFNIVGSLNPDEVFDSPDLSKVRGGEGNSFWLNNFLTHTKKEMVKLLDGKQVRCFFIEDNNYNLFGVQDIENNKVYILDENI